MRLALIATLTTISGAAALVALGFEAIAKRLDKQPSKTRWRPEF